MPAALSINLNKVALIRNSRGRNVPDLLEAADAAIAAGAHGITLHPRLDQRHVRFDDVPAMAGHLARHHRGIELNVECEPDAHLLEMVLEIRPHQCTLVPVTPGEVTSDHGWRLPQDADTLARAIEPLKAAGIRTSAFADCEPAHVPRFAAVGVDRVELYTGPYAWAWGTAEQQVECTRLYDTAKAATAAGLGVNAGHDLDHHNLVALQDLVDLAEVSIGHAYTCRALEVGRDQAMAELLRALGWPPASRAP